jgi:hypothetical protein
MILRYRLHTWVSLCHSHGTHDRPAEVLRANSRWQSIISRRTSSGRASIGENGGNTSVSSVVHKIASGYAQSAMVPVWKVAARDIASEAHAKLKRQHERLLCGRVRSQNCRLRR